MGSEAGPLRGRGNTMNRRIVVRDEALWEDVHRNGALRVKQIQMRHLMRWAEDPSIDTKPRVVVDVTVKDMAASRRRRQIAQGRLKKENGLQA